MKAHIKRRYSDRDKARIAITLQSNDGNVKRTARELGLPWETIREYKKRWETNGYPENLEELLPAERGDFVVVATEVRWELLEALREKAERRELKGTELITGIGVLTDKINLLSGGATSRTEKVTQSEYDPNELAKVLISFAEKTTDSATAREKEINDVEDNREGTKLALVK